MALSTKVPGLAIKPAPEDDVPIFFLDQEGGKVRMFSPRSDCHKDYPPKSLFGEYRVAEVII